MKKSKPANTCVAKTTTIAKDDNNALPVLFRGGAEHFVKGKRHNQLTQGHIDKIIKTYQSREEEARYLRRVVMSRLRKPLQRPNKSTTPF